MRLFSKHIRHLSLIKTKFDYNPLLQSQIRLFSDKTTGLKEVETQRSSLFISEDALLGRERLEKVVSEPVTKNIPLTSLEINELKNKRVIRREFLNDFIGISLKLTSLMYSTSNVQAFKAE